MKLPPHNTEAEGSVIGSILIDDACLNQVKFLKASDLFSEPCRIIFDSFLALADRHEAINQITVAQELERTGNLKKAGGASYLSSLISGVPTTLDIEYYADIVHRLSVNRQLIQASSQIAELAYDAEPDMDKTIKASEQIIQAVKASAGIRKLEIVTPKEMADTMLDIFQQGEACLKWGFYDLDEVTTGIYQQDYIIVAGRPSMGKTELLLAVAENIAKQDKKILFVSGEMGRNPILERYASRSLKMSVKEFRKRQFGLDQETQYMEAVGNLSQSSIYYLFGNRTSDNVWSQATKMKESIGLDIIFIDYLQLLRDCWERGESKATAVGRVSANIRGMTSDLSIPVVVASQLNRALEYRDDKVPTLSDLRESGNLEQDADVVLMIHRPDQYRKESEAIPGQTEIYMAKNRQLGYSPKPVILQWNYNMHRLVDLRRE